MITSLKLKYFNLRLEVVRPAIERFLEKINVAEDGCWEWLAGKNTDGYAHIWINSKLTVGSRFIYEYYHGQICPDLTIDHLCRNRACVNPSHLEQVTNRENILRGLGFAGINSRKTHCIRGHEFDDKNTYIFRRTGSRICKKCRGVREKEYRLKYPERTKRLQAIKYARWYKKRQQARLK